jgi:hypothetical protein
LLLNPLILFFRLLYNSFSTPLSYLDMKTLSFTILCTILAVTASPLGNHAIFRRHNGAQPLDRRYILQSRMNIPPQCASVSGSVPSATDPNVAIPSGLTLPSDLFPTDSTGALNAVPTAGSAVPTGSRRSFTEFGFDEELNFSSFVETWESLCLRSGGDIYTFDPCSQYAGFAGINALLEFANPCDQQHIADAMITFAKSKGIRNKDSLINFALKYRKHYRNSVEILGVIPSSFYCLERPVNPELVGVYNAQISGANPGIFGSPSSPLAPFGSTGTCPLDMTVDMSTCSCVSSASSGNSTSTDTSANSGATAAVSSNVTATATGSSNVTAIATDSSAATATDSSASAATDSSATATDSASLASATDSSAIAATDSAALASATVAATNTFSTGINVQPTDISGNVNDPAGR